MADIELIIKISEEDYKSIKDDVKKFLSMPAHRVPILYEAVNKGILLPKEKTGEWLRMSDLSEQEDDRYKCSYCGNVVHHKDKMNLYTFNNWCGRCGSNNRRQREVT